MECPKCGDKTEGAMVVERGVILSTYREWNGDAIDSNLDHTRPPAKFCVCQACGARVKIPWKEKE